MRRAASVRVMVAVLSFAAGCGGASTEVRGPPDAPEPASEPRATLKVELDLPRLSACEEDFDVALYASRAVELVAWSPSPSPCTGRHATVRYFPKRISAESLRKRIQELSTRVEVSE